MSPVHSGIVTLAGKPNAGKSTLMNRIVGQKLGIVSPKPQSTRDRVVGIVTSDAMQMVFLDTPGLLEPAHLLHRSMRETARAALDGADVILHMIDAIAEQAPIEPLTKVAGLAHAPSGAVITVFNKCDGISDTHRAKLAESHADAHFISALTGEGVNELLAAIKPHLPESPFLYPDDDVSAQSVRFFVSEMIREAALEQLDQEVPYSLACEIEEYRENSTPLYIRATLYVERESQKGIVIGARGSRIKEIGSAARLKIEAFLGAAVFLDLRVKVLADWRRNKSLLKRFGYNVHEEESR